MRSFLHKFQAVVLVQEAQSGLRYVGSHTPLELLPLALKPMLLYPLKQLLAAGAETVIFATCGSATYVEAIQAYVEEIANSVTDSVKAEELRDLEIAPGAQKPKLLVVHVAPGTPLQMLRKVADRLGDLRTVLMPGTVVSNIPIQSVLKIHEYRKATATCVLIKRKGAASPQQGESPRHVDYVAVDKSKDALLFFDSTSGKRVKVPYGLVHAYGEISLTTVVQDSLIYLLSGQLLAALTKGRLATLRDIRTELIPYLCEEQARTILKRVSHEQEACLPKPTRRSTTSTELQQEQEEPQLDVKAVGLYLVEEHSSDSYYSLVKDPHSFLETSKDLACSKEAGSLTGLTFNEQLNGYILSKDHLAQRNFGNSCVVGQSTTSGEKSSIKRSVVGSGCVLEEKAKVMNSVIMDHVTIGKGCNIEKCVIGNQVVVHDGSVLKDCIVGPGVIITAKSNLCEETVPAKSSQ